jgi:translocation and assembly module TamB
MTRFRRLGQVTRYIFLAFLLLLLLLSAFLWYLTTDSFQLMVRSRLVSAIERASGGRAELGSFHVVPLRFQVEVRNLTIHGREAPGQVPLLHVDSMSAIVDLSSLLGAKLGFHDLKLVHPVIHVIFYPDGSTNAPAARASTVRSEHLLSIGVDRLEVESGELLWQDEPIPLEFVSDNISATLDYSFLRLRYLGQLSIGRAETRLAGYRPLAWAGTAGFSVSRNSIEINSLVIGSERSLLKAKGILSDFRHPNFTGSYDLLVDLAQAGAVARDARLKSGILEIKGSGSWSRQTFSSGGTFLLGDFALQAKAVNFKNASAAGVFAADPQKISLSQVQGRIFGGTFTSDAAVSDWQAPEVRTSSKTEQRGSVRIKMKDISLAEVRASLGRQFRPASQLMLAGNLSGASELRWTGTIRNAEISTTTDISRPARVLPGEIPVSAAIVGSYGLRSGSLAIENLSANTPATQIRASGALAAESALRLFFSTSNLHEWEPLTVALFPSGPPFSLNGRATFNGSASGRLSSVSWAGNLQAQDFDALIPRKRSGIERVHFDSGASNMQLSASALSLDDAVVRSGNAIFRFSGRVALSAWNVSPESRIHWRAEVENADAAQLARIGGLRVPVRGQLNANGRIFGSMANPAGEGSIRLSGGAVEGHRFDSAVAFVQLENGHAAFRNFQVTRGQAQISGGGAYDPSADTIQLNLAGTNLDVAEFSPQETRIHIAGMLDFTAEASGSTAEPDVNAHLHFRDVKLNDETAGNYLIDAVTHGADMRLTGRSDFPDAELSIDGNVHLRQLWPAQINLHFARLDVATPR